MVHHFLYPPIFRFEIASPDFHQGVTVPANETTRVPIIFTPRGRFGCFKDEILMTFNNSSLSQSFTLVYPIIAISEGVL